ncbi:nuclear transport factor 2 family protein [Klebsiella sp. T2.Ur]|nr:nuclear transport factor 2 family protein [Klebsiella sp. T2.Ur]
MITITTVLDEIINQQELPLELILNRHFSPGYRQRTDNEWEGLDGFAQHARKLREIIASGKIEVYDELRDGNLYATRHRVQCTKRDGKEVEMEVYMFAETDDSGRFIRVEEATLMLKGAESDRDLGSAR